MMQHIKAEAEVSRTFILYPRMSKYLVSEVSTASPIGDSVDLNIVTPRIALPFPVKLQ